MIMMMMVGMRTWDDCAKDGAKDTQRMTIWNVGTLDGLTSSSDGAEDAMTIWDNGAEDGLTTCSDTKRRRKGQCKRR